MWSGTPSKGVSSSLAAEQVKSPKTQSPFRPNPTPFDRLAGVYTPVMIHGWNIVRVFLFDS